MLNSTTSRTAKKLALFSLAKSIATHAHRNQTRWDSNPYIVHPTRIANNFWTEDNSAEIKIKDLGFTEGQIIARLVTASVAYLHDVLEDCLDEYSLDSLNEAGITHDVLWPVVLLTKLPMETYHQYLHRLLGSGSVIALSVKIADILDNCSDLIQFGAKKRDKIDKYMLALEMIKGSELYKKNDLVVPSLKQKMEDFLSVSADITKVGTD